MTDWGAVLSWTLFTFGKALLILLPMLFWVIMSIYADRKIWAGVQMRKGPNVVGPFGLFQIFADGIKFLLKEIVIPAGADKAVFLLAPLISVVVALAAWSLIPFAPGWVAADVNVGILALLAISSTGLYGIIMGGWASNSKYPFLGALRSAAQMVSYEVSIGFVIITVVLLTGSMRLQTIIEKQAGGFWNWNIFGGDARHNLPLAIVMIPMAVIFLISALAETNRPPFDLPEAESELVAGYQVEYSSTPWLLFMLAEYCNISLLCGLLSILFFGGWQAPFPTPFLSIWSPTAASFFGLFWLLLKTGFFFFMFAMIKAVVPRYRYDQLMRLGWKVFLPTSLVAIVVVAAWRVYTPLG